MNKLQMILEQDGYVLLDGAMGTMLMAAGLEQGDPPEEWNTLYPERIQAIHQQYIKAGSRLILSNSFGGTRFRLKLHNLQERVAELNQAAATNARAAAAAAPHTVVVAGSIGPTGELLQPMGEMTEEEAVAAFSEQAAALAKGGVDILWVETMSDLNEVKAAITGARAACDLPIAVTMTFDTNRHTMMGVSPAVAATTLQELNLAAIGANCGNGPTEIEQVIQRMHQTNPDLLLIAKSNAGIPKWENETLIYDGTPEVMSAYAHRVHNLGARLIGGCCGNTPAHIQRMKQALDDPTSVPVALLAEMDTQVAEEDTPSNSRTRRQRRRRRDQ